MQIDNDAVRRTGPQTKYNFEGVSNGSSVWVETNAERVSLLDAFKRWTAKNETDLVAVSSKVGSEDKRGPGYRVFFERRKVALKPAVIAKLPKFSAELQEIQIWRLNHTGIFTDEDILAAAASCDPVPTTIQETANVRKLIFAGMTPFQIDYCVRHHGKSMSAQRADAHAEMLRREAEHEESRAKYLVTDEMRRSEAQALAQVERELKSDDA